MLGELLIDLLGFFIEVFVLPALAGVVVVGVGIALIKVLGSMGILGGIAIADEFKIRRAMPYDRSDQVQLRQSPLFLAFLKQIEDGTLKTLYVNPHMACVNFTDLDSISESEVLDFQKCGWASISQGRVNQYMRQLVSAARRTPYVQSVSVKWQEMPAQPYLAYGGHYNRCSYPDKCPVMEITYSTKIRKKKGLQSFRQKP